MNFSQEEEKKKWKIIIIIIYCPVEGNGDLLLVNNFFLKTDYCKILDVKFVVSVTLTFD